MSYRETVKRAGAFLIVDVQAQSANRRKWRYLGRLPESMFNRVIEVAFYEDVTEDVARRLDQVLDGACVAALALRWP